MQISRLFPAVAIALMAAPHAPAVAQPTPSPITGVASVRDGDTIEIGGREIRMQGIDAPESGQRCEDEAGREWRCGQAAALALDAMIGGRTVTCEIDPRDPQDRYGRALGWCKAGGEALSERMAREGWAMAYRRYLDYETGEARPYKARMLAAELEARTARRGIWRGRFDRPDMWRRANRR